MCQCIWTMNTSLPSTFLETLWTGMRNIKVHLLLLFLTKTKKHPTIFDGMRGHITDWLGSSGATFPMAFPIAFYILLFSLVFSLLSSSLYYNTIFYLSHLSFFLLQKQHRCRWSKYHYLYYGVWRHLSSLKGFTIFILSNLSCECEVR